MVTEFNLSEKIIGEEMGFEGRIKVSYVKKFIKLLKKLADEGIDNDGCVIPVQWFKDEIDKLAGDKLI